MQTLVAFDITSNRLRRRITIDCQDAGMERTQFSVFLGGLSAEERENLIATFREHINTYTQHSKEEKKEEEQEEEDDVGRICIQIFPICAACFENAAEIGSEGRGSVEACTLPDVLVL
jgi:CRISPR/Cas system-associated endoribonuclease Cas2